MSRIITFLVGAVLAAAAGLFLISSTYALWQALEDGEYQQMVYPGAYAAGSLIVLLVALRMSLRAVAPGFTFTKLILVTVAVAALLHVGGCLSLSSETLRGCAENIQKWMRRVRKTVPEVVEDADQFRVNSGD